jgi:hypothetical protein
MFLRDQTMGHHLPSGRMPCKWHGYEGECCGRDSFFSRSGPRACHASDGSVIYKFSTRFCCSTHRDEAATPKVAADGGSENESNSQDEDNHFYYFAGHDPQVVAQHPQNLRSTLGAAITKKRAFTSELVDEIIDLAAETNSFQAIHRMLVMEQKRAFYQKTRDFYSVRASTVMQGTIYGGTDPLLSGNLELEQALPYNFPSRQYV